MKINKSRVLILVSMVLTSIILANILNIFSTSAVNIGRKNNTIKIADSEDYLIWFLQITDIHISIFKDPFRISEFKEFCDYTVDAIKPKVVIASGDLTDAKTQEGIGSRQFVEEWQYYSNILKECQITKKTTWLDIRGNHDNFNVAGPDSKQNFFTNYSIQGRQHSRSYLYQLHNSKSREIYSFIGVDACLEPGPRRPFNFIGLLDQLEIKQLNYLIEKTIKTGSNYTIWFGHFPTSCILSTGKENIRQIISKDPNGVTYICGHLHQLGGLIKKMYTLQKGGFLELELSDWKDNRIYRLFAIDHGMVSFIDVKHRQWPIALVTNPKHALFLNNAKENINNILLSSHIRILAFSLSKITHVRIRIDNGLWMSCDQINHGSLYVYKWNPKEYAYGLHLIDVKVRDFDGREQIYTQSFQLDDKIYLKYDVLSRIVLMTDASTVFQTMFGVTLLISILPLLLLRILQKFVLQGKLSKPKLRKGFGKLWLRKFWILSTIDRIFWPIILYPLYLSFGPWSIGHLIEDHIGVIFAWGIFVNGAFLPGSFTYAYGFIQLFTFQIPLTIILAHGVDIRFQHKVLNHEKTFCAYLSLHLPFLIVFLIQVIMAYLFWLAYGFVAFILGPLRTWSLVLAAILWYNALYLPEHCIRQAARVWHYIPDSSTNENPSQSSPQHSNLPKQQ